jgi:signal transduction histidine kinase
LDLEKKTFLIILATLTVVAGLSAVIADRLVLESFRSVEQGAGQADLDRMHQAVQGEVDELDRLARDWAHWDDAYSFVQGQEPEFEQSNLVPNSFEANGLALMVFLDADDHVVYGAAYDASTGNLTDLPVRFSVLSPAGPLLSHPDESTSIKGLLGADGRVFVVSSWPILTSTEEGPAVGTLVWARELDVAGIAAATRLDLSLRPYASADDDRLADGSELVAVSRSRQTAMARVDDLLGQPAFVLEADMERPIYRQGLNTMAYVFASAILVGGGLLVAMIVLLNTTVLSRLTRLTHRVELLGEDPHGRVDVSGADEISRLSAEFNRLLDRLDRHQMRLEASNADLRQFAAVVSHDLQPPLSTVALNAAVLREHNKGRLDDETLERLERIESTALRMAGHIRAILDYSRVTYEAPGFEQVDLGSVMAEVTGHLEERLQATKGRIEYTSLPTLEANPTQMVQLLQNLVANGLKFHRPGVPPVVKVLARATDGGRIHLSVEDNGEGFDAPAFERMRKPYIRLPGRGTEGHGLGLATADKIVSRHHGRLWADSTPGKGTTIHVELPVRQGLQASG